MCSLGAPSSSQFLWGTMTFLFRSISSLKPEHLEEKECSEMAIESILQFHSREIAFIEIALEVYPSPWISWE